MHAQLSLLQQRMQLRNNINSCGLIWQLSYYMHGDAWPGMHALLRML